MQALKGLFMERWMCLGSLGVASLFSLLFLLDLLLGFPFGGMMMVDIFGLLAGGFVLYLGVDAARDLR